MSKQKENQKENQKNKIKYGQLEQVKYCPACGVKNLMQYPNEEIEGILRCISCKSSFKIIIIE